MKKRAFFYDASTGRVTGSLDYDEAVSIPAPPDGQAMLSLDRPTFEEIQAGSGIDPGNPDWVIDGALVLTSTYPAAEVSTAGLTATLSTGHLWTDSGHFENTAEDAHTFEAPAADTAVALDVVVEDATGAILLAYYTWNHLAEPPETKGDPPAGHTVLISDVLRGILPAGATSLDQLTPEEV